MKEKYKGKIKVPFCVKYSDPIHGDLEALFYELLGGERRISGVYDYYGIRSDGVWDADDDPTYFAENTTVYTLEELQAIVDGVNKEESLTSEVWIDWKGGDCPVSANTLVEVEFDNGLFDTDLAGCYDWEHSYYCHNITAYRIVNTPKTSCSDDTATLTEDEYVDVGEDETVSNESVESNTIIKANVSFDVTIKGQTFNLTPEELQDLYLQLCVAEGTLQDWRLGQ